MLNIVEKFLLSVESMTDSLKSVTFRNFQEMNQTRTW